MISMEPGPQTRTDDQVADIPDCWWRDHLFVAVWILVAGMVVLFLRYAAEVFVPLVLSALVFYSLDPAVDWLERRHVPRALAAALMLGMVIAGVGFMAFTLRDDVAKVVADLPEGARRLRAALSEGDGSSTLETLRQATKEIDKAAADAAGSAPAPSGVVRVQVEQPIVRPSDYLWSGSVGLASLAPRLVMVCFLAYFLLVANDIFKRKLVKHAAATLTRKKITVNVLNAIGRQIERFFLVQIVTSALVAVVTGLALWWVGLDNAAVWGLAAGILNSIPYFGPFIVTFGLAALAFLQFGTFEMVGTVAAVALLITTLEGWLLTPALLGKASQMNAVAIFAGLLFWSWMWGFWGTLLAVPMMAVVKAICDHVEDFQPISDFLSE
jgi:predicted PurR-regulated permease PerM